MRFISLIIQAWKNRARINRIKRDTIDLINAQQMEAGVFAYIRELEAKIDMQGKAIRAKDREIENLKCEIVDQGMDLSDVAGRMIRG